MNLLENKIQQYYQKLEQQHVANELFMDELLVLVRDCEENYHSVMAAPDDSPEMLAIWNCIENEPELTFNHQFIAEIPSARVSWTKRSIIDLHTMGFSNSQVSQILELNQKYVATRIRRHKEARGVVHNGTD